MRERPILYSPPMVRAVLAGTKTMTRRAIKWKPHDPDFNLTFLGIEPGLYCTGHRESGWVLRSKGGGGCWNDRTTPTFCPYGVPGDRLWVREPWCADVSLDDLRPSEIDPSAGICYKTGGTLRNARSSFQPGRYRHARFMPRWVSRITLEVTDVRVERLGEITDEDARAEGVLPRDGDGHRGYVPASQVFAELWDSLHGPGSFEQSSSAFVWVISFRRVT